MYNWKCRPHIHDQSDEDVCMSVLSLLLPKHAEWKQIITINIIYLHDHNVQIFSYVWKFWCFSAVVDWTIKATSSGLEILCFPFTATNGPTNKLSNKQWECYPTGKGTQECEVDHLPPPSSMVWECVKSYITECHLYTQISYIFFIFQHWALLMYISI